MRKGYKMKKIILFIGLMGSLMGADIYSGIGMSLSNITDKGLQCRMNTVITTGIEIDKTVSIESRLAKGFDRAYASQAIYVKPRYKYTYGLLGFKHQRIHNEHINDVAYGVGLQLNTMSFELERSGGYDFFFVTYIYKF